MVDNRAALANIVARARDCESIALDTEFVWERTYYPRLGIIQVALEGHGCFLIDAVTLGDLSPLAEILADPDTVKILHDAHQDLTIIRRATGAFPCNVFDTRVAAGFAGLRPTTSLREMVLEITGVELEKSETRTNWLQRPLSPQQLTYAIEDVCHLHQACQTLTKRVSERNCENWMWEELDHLDEPALYSDPDPRLYFHRLKASRGLSPKDLAVLRELADWRECEAQRRNRPRNHVLTDRALLIMAKRKPTTQQALLAIPQISARAVAHYGRDLLGRIEDGLATEPSECPVPTLFPADKNEVETKLETIWNRVAVRASKYGVNPELIATKNEIRALICYGDEEHRLINGWRRQFLGSEFVDRLAREAPVAMRRRPPKRR